LNRSIDLDSTSANIQQHHNTFRIKSVDSVPGKTRSITFMYVEAKELGRQCCHLRVCKTKTTW